MGEGDFAAAQYMALAVFCLRVLGAALAYVSQVILARVLGEFEYGVFVVVWTLVVILGIFLPLGFSSSVTRLIPEYQVRGDDERLRGLLVGSRWVAFAGATLFAVVGALGLFLLEPFITSYYVLPLYLGAFCLPLFTVGSIQDGIARAYNQTLMAILPTFIWRPLAILFALVVAVACGAPATAATACYAAIFATWAVALAQMLRLRHFLSRTIPKGAAKWEVGVWAGVSLPILLVEGFFQLITSADVIMVSFWRPPDEVAIYFAASKTLALAHFVYFAVRSASAHRFSRLYQDGDREALAIFVKQAVSWTFWPTLLVACGLLVVGPLLLSMFGSAFTAAYPVLAILLIGVLARAAIGPVDALLTMADQQRSCAVIYAGSFAVNIALNVLLIPSIGVLGAALATTIGIVLEATALFFAARKYLGLHAFVFSRSTQLQS